jgi:hypothetical protein
LIVAKKKMEQKERKHREYLELLHRYNFVKDLTQDIFGKLAQQEGCTLKELHIEYDVDLEE